MEKEKKSLSIVKKMIIAVAAGFAVGFLCLFLKTRLINTGSGSTWEFINRLLFQDITKDEGINSIGIFYIIGQLFMQALQLGIVPLVLVSISLSIGEFAKPGKLGKIATKTLLCFVVFYIVGATLSGGISYFVKSRGFFDVNLPEMATDGVTTMESYNPLTVLLNAVPSNITEAFSSNNSILAVVVVGIIIGLCMNEMQDKTRTLKEVLKSVDEIIHMYLNFLINKICPLAIFCMISRTFAIYGVEYLKPVTAFVVTGIFIGMFLVFTIYPIGIYLTTRLNPFIFIKKVLKIGLFAAATNSSAATLPLNMKTCQEELGCSEELTSFILPLGMTINMNGTTAMHMLAIIFITTAAGIDISPSQLVLTALLSIAMAMGCPAVPVAGTTMVFAVLSGLGMLNDVTMVGYALVMAMNYPVGMSVITMNVVGDAATNVIICHKEGELDQAVYYQSVR